jgi:hypothetical protein
MEAGPTASPVAVVIPWRHRVAEAWRRWRFERRQKSRQTIREEDGVHKAWYDEARAVRTLADFNRFYKKVMDGYNHDYGTVVHALACVSLAGACLANRHKDNGGITGFQAGAVMWQWLEGWGTGPKRHGRMLDYDNMLYPQYGYQFTTISPKVWAALQEKAAAELAQENHGHPDIRKHWQSIVDGQVPFGYTVKES